MNRRGVTLIELLITVVIGAIAMFALVPPFLAEGSFFRKGKRQTEAQRDAQMTFRAMAYVARESNNFSVDFPGPDHGQVTFTTPDFPSGDCDVIFEGGPTVEGGKFKMRFLDDQCGSDLTLIDGQRSRVTKFLIESVVPKKLVRLHLELAHQLRTTDALTEDEVLETELFLRNGS